MPERADLPDIVLVVFDTARWDRFGCYGYPRPTTPTVDSLARTGMRVETMVANAPWTLPSHASLFTGLYPSEHGSQWRTGPKFRPGVEITLAEWLKGIGYDTWCVTNNGLISERTGLSRGFDHYVFRLDLEKGLPRVLRRMQKVAIGADSGGRIVNRWMQRELPKAGRPMFLFVNYLDCHWSWAPPPRFARRVGGPRYGPGAALRYRALVAGRQGPWQSVAEASPEDLERFSTYYDGELASTDHHLEVLLETLRGLGRLREDGSTLVMVTSDHGEHIGEHGLADHHAALDDVLTRVPFVAWGPGIVAPGVSEGLQELVDVFPSLARLLGEEPPAGYLEGRPADLFGEPAARDRYAFLEWKAWTEKERGRLAKRNPAYDFTGLARDLLGVRDMRFKLVRGSDGTEVLYDLQADPSEEREVAAERPDDAARLRAELDRAVERWRTWEGESAEVSEAERAEIEQRLSELGYI